MFTMLNVVYDHFLTRKTQFFTLFMLSRTSDNNTSQNIGEDQCMGGPPPQILGRTVPPVPPRSPPLLIRGVLGPTTAIIRLISVAYSIGFQPVVYAYPKRTTKGMSAVFKGHSGKNILTKYCS